MTHSVLFKYFSGFCLCSFSKDFIGSLNWSLLRKFSFLLFLWSHQLQAQEQTNAYTQADSLRGYLFPERSCYDVHFYDINLTIDFQNRQIAGHVDVYFKIIENTKRIQLDLYKNMVVDSVVWLKQKMPIQRIHDAFYIDFQQTLQNTDFHKVRVYYHGSPNQAKMPPWDGGFVWRKTPSGEHWLGVAVQGDGASLWWPNKDHLSDEPDSVMVSCTYPKDLFFVGNGRIQNDVVENHLRTTSWKVTYPINNYNVTLNIGPYKYFNDTHQYSKSDSLTLDYFVLPQNYNKAIVHFDQVKPMMNCFEEYFGKYPFPRDGYKLVETPYLGMEHQSCVAYGNGYKNGYMGVDYSGIGLEFDFIIIHETGHEWWGNLVSVEDLADLWIHEGFCTYAEVLYVECMHGKQKALDYINYAKRRVQNTKALIPPYGVNAQGPGDIYTKGALLVHNIRFIVDNDSLFFAWIKGITEEFGYKTTNTEQLIEFTNRFFGQRLSAVFNEFLLYPDLPTLEYRINGKKKLKYRWKSNEKTFDMPVVFDKNRIFPEQSWKTLKIKQNHLTEANFNTDISYFNLKKVK